MLKLTVIVIVIFILNIILCVKNDIFQESSKISFHPDSLSEYFGYTVLLSSTGLVVGAPKATSRENKLISPGLVFICRLDNLNTANVTCYPLGMNDGGGEISFGRVMAIRDFFKDDMWFGASVAAVPNGKLLVCAPRWSYPYKEKHLLANGACYIQTRKRGMSLMPFRDMNRQAFRTNGVRKEYGEYGTHLNFYAYGQAGMSVKETGNNSVIIGAPGLLQWTGGIVDYRYLPDPDSVFFSKQPTTNPYYTKDLGPDDYFGYSVESGIFELNGNILYVAGAPRSKMGYGQVLIFEPTFRELDPLSIKAKVRGPQLGSYFGASLCCTDIDGDGRTDLLVGAPNYVKKDGGLPYDQGAVFVYMTREQDKEIFLEDSGYVTGSGASGARFGTAIADLGDVDDDGFKDIAVGAPWEDNGLGAVYIYKGNNKGLNAQYVQRIVAESSKSFGISISKGYDVDNNNCNDLAIGAHSSATAYIYRCVPTIQLHASIKVPDAMDLPQNATNFTALFCITVPPKKNWPHVKIDLKATIKIDQEGHRAKISGDSVYVYNLSARPGNNVCDEQTVEIKPTADLSRPITMVFDLEEIDSLKDFSTFRMDAARLSENSNLHSTFVIQVTRDCGDDLICKPWLHLALESLGSPYVPGSDSRLGATISVLNTEEPAYGAKVYLELPLPPKRVPRSCTLQNLNITCNVPAPLYRNESVTWEIELEYTLKSTTKRDLKIVANLDDPLYGDHITGSKRKELLIAVIPEANFSINGKALPNETVPVTREELNEAGLVSFSHYYEITNFGPSDWSDLTATISLSKMLNLSSPIKGCAEEDDNLNCIWSVPAKVTLPIILQLRLNLIKYGELLDKETILNVTTNIQLVEQNMTASVTSKLVLDPAQPIWPLIVGSISGVLLLATIVYGLYKYGFFSRDKREELKRLQEQDPSENKEPSGSASGLSTMDADGSTHELLNEDSD